MELDSREKIRCTSCKMKKRDKRTKQEVRGSKSNWKGTKSEFQGSKQDIRGSRRHTSNGATNVATPRPRTKRSGVEAVKFHLQATGHNGRSSRSATAVSTILTIKNRTINQFNKFSSSRQLILKLQRHSLTYVLELFY